MADSETSRTLPAFSNRNLLSRVAHILKNNFPSLLFAGNLDGVAVGQSDPSLTLWRTWHTAYNAASKLGRTQARLETKLLSLVKAPRSKLRDNGTNHFGEHEVNIGNGRSRAGETVRAPRASPRAELVEDRAAWDEADAMIGFSTAKRAEEEAMALNEEAAARLWNSPARSIVGVTGKLHALISIGEPSPDTDEFPWPQLRLILRDMLSMIDTPGRQRR